jgi:copper chaperone CopZ
VVAAEASYRQGNVVTEYEPAKVTPDQIAGAINAQTYYRATGIVVGGGVGAGSVEDETSAGQTATAVIRVEGMTDDLVASEVLSAMGGEGAITDASVDLSASTLTVEFDPAKTQAGLLELAINGYTPYPATVLSTTEAEAAAGAAAKTFDVVKYAVWGIVAVVVLGLAWSGLTWGRRQLAPAPAPTSKVSRSRQRRRRDRGHPPK